MSAQYAMCRSEKCASAARASLALASEGFDLMRARRKEQEYCIKNIKNFNLNYTLNCGQVFRWNFTGRDWVGVVENSAVRVKQINRTLIFETDLESEAVSNYFRLEDDLEEIYRCIAKDRDIERAIELFRGLRLLRQDPWECLISFMCSSASNIPRIQNVIENLCKSLGSSICEGYFGFPAPEQLSCVTERELRNCGLGFRAPFVLEAAKLIAGEEIDLHRLKAMDYVSAKRELKAIKGVGDKIADCVLLFSCDKLEAFPVDTHIRQYMQQTYFGSKSVSNSRIRSFARSYFGKCCGYAQQYIYIYQREKRQRI